MGSVSLYLVNRNYCLKNLVLQVIMLFSASSLAKKGYDNG